MNREPLHLPAPKERATEKLQLLPCNCIHIFKLVFGKRNIHGMQSAMEDTSFSTGRGKAALASINENVTIPSAPFGRRFVANSISHPQFSAVLACAVPRGSPDLQHQQRGWLSWHKPRVTWSQPILRTRPQPNPNQTLPSSSLRSQHANQPRG